jgi:hypothetical protein
MIFARVLFASSHQLWRSQQATLCCHGSLEEYRYYIRERSLCSHKSSGVACYSVGAWVSPSHPSRFARHQKGLLVWKQVWLQSFSHLDYVTAYLPNMTCLSIEGDRFSELDMLRLASVTRLRSLRLHRCTAKKGPADANSIAVLSSLTNLEHLEIYDVHGPSPQVLPFPTTVLTS